MHRNKKIALVIVAYNEERLILPTLEKAPAFVDKIIVVSDASTDQTSSIVLERKKKDARVELIEHATNKGVGQAIITGYTKARDEKFDVTVVVGGDDQMP